MFSRMLGSRQGGPLLLALTYVLLGTLLRLGFLLASAGEVSWGIATFGALFVGLAFDLVMAWFLTLPFGLLCTWWPTRGWRAPLIGAWTFGAFLFAFWKISEILFWEEFGVRFNFIAVDYLVYTTEVVKNIKESYNLPAILAVVAAVAVGGYLLMFVAQVATEIFVWKRWRSPIWVIVPCLYLAWRLWQCWWGFTLDGVAQSSLAACTLVALFVLWVINIGVHFTNIPLTMRWDHHAPGTVFKTLHHPVALAPGAHDPLE